MMNYLLFHKKNLMFEFHLMKLLCVSCYPYNWPIVELISPPGVLFLCLNVVVSID